MFSRTRTEDKSEPKERGLSGSCLGIWTTEDGVSRESGCAETLRMSGFSFVFWNSGHTDEEYIWGRKHINIHLDTQSRPLDLGRGTRLHATSHQTKMRHMQVA